MKNRLVVILLSLLTCVGVAAQKNVLLRPSIKTLAVERNGEWNSIPYINLGSGDYLHISFDDLTHEYRRYRYRIEPMSWDWKPNERLFASEFLKIGTGDEPIDNYEESVNTTVLYTHYQFDFPNKNIVVGLSGNYQIVIYDDDEEEDVAVIPFYVVENSASFNNQVTTNTDIDFNKDHQQLMFTMQPSSALQIHYPESEVHTVVMQNLRQSSAVVNPAPDYITPQGLRWEHCKELIFPAGSEYHKFELTTMRYGGMGVDNVRWYDPYYHVTLYENKPQKNYIYNEDKNGAYCIRNIDYEDKDLESEYVWVHFVLDMDVELDGKVYVNGDFTNDQLTEEFEMKYNADTKRYESVLLLKQGYYNYQYLYVGSDSRQSLTKKVQGDFFQTENRYTIFAYYSQRGSRYDRLIGLSDFQFIPSKR